jgi:hypothetical protein
MSDLAFCPGRLEQAAQKWIVKELLRRRAQTRRLLSHFARLRVPQAHIARPRRPKRQHRLVGSVRNRLKGIERIHVYLLDPSLALRYLLLPWCDEL